MPLLYDHNAAEPAGTIDELRYDAAGNLTVRATVTHAKAKRCNAFSIGGKVRAYTIKNADSPNFYAAVSRAELTDVSLVECPVNPRALVQSRQRQAPPVEFWDLMAQRVALYQQLVTLMMKDQRA